LLAGKAIATAIVTLLSMLVVLLLGVLLGWRPSGAWPISILIVLLAAFTFATWGLFLAGALRAEAVLAVANGVFLTLILFGGIIISPDQMPDVLGSIIEFTPSAALVEALNIALASKAPGTASLLMPAIVLAVWGAIGALLARRYFRWE
jgi:ABC-2 type transport system permease protein